MKIHSRSLQRGLSLVELMVSVTAGLLVLAIGTSLLISTLGSNTSTLRYTRFNQDLRGVLNAISHDIERAGTWGLAGEVVQMSSQTDLMFSDASGDVTATALARGTTSTNNAFGPPFSAEALQGRRIVLLVPVTVSGVTTSQRFNFDIESVDDNSTLSGELVADDPPSGAYEDLPSTLVRAGSWTVLNPFGIAEVTTSCVRYRYDLNLDGIVDDNEHFGFRYDSGTKAIEARTSAGSCNSTDGWEDVTDPRMVELSSFTVTALQTTAVKNQLNVGIREYLVRINGALKSENGVGRSVEAAVKVRNNSVD